MILFSLATRRISRKCRRHPAKAAEHHDLLMVSGLAEHMPCTGPGSSKKQARHDLDTINTTFGLERAGRPLQESPDFSVINNKSSRQLPRIPLELHRHYNLGTTFQCQPLLPLHDGGMVDVTSDESSMILQASNGCCESAAARIDHEISGPTEMPDERFNFSQRTLPRVPVLLPVI